MSVQVASSTSHLLLLPSSPSDARRPVLPPLSIALPEVQPAAKDYHHHHLHLGTGLRTPPVDDMSTTYQQAPAAYDSHALRSYASSMAHAGRPKAAAASEARTANVQYYRYPPLQQNQQARNVHTTPSDRSAKSTTPASVVSAKDAVPSRRSSDTLIYHSLQIPRCISASGGSLTDFAAQVSPTAPPALLEENLPLTLSDDVPLLVRIH